MHKGNDDLGTLILEAARDLIGSGGYDNLSMRKIAERIGYSPAAIYRHFRDREAIVTALSEEALTVLLKSLQDLNDAETDPLKLLRKALLNYLQFGVSVREQHSAAGGIPPWNPWELRGKRTGLRLYRLFRGMVQHSVQEKGIRELDADLVAQGLLGVAHGFTSLAGIDTFPWKDRAALAEHLVDVQIRGLAG